MTGFLPDHFARVALSLPAVVPPEDNAALVLCRNDLLEPQARNLTASLGLPNADWDDVAISYPDEATARAGATALLMTIPLFSSVAIDLFGRGPDGTFHVVQLNLYSAITDAE